MHSNERGECFPRTLVDRKQKRYDNAVDVVVRLHDPTDPSTKCTAPPGSAHVQLDDVPSCCRNSSTTSPLLLDREGEDVTEPNVCRTQRCRAFGTLIGRIVKTYDYINRVVITLLLSVYEGT